jgi:hypothetical protein
MAGVASLYSAVVQPDARLRPRFLAALVKPFEDAVAGALLTAHGHAAGGTAASLRLTPATAGSGRGVGAAGTPASCAGTPGGFSGGGAGSSAAAPPEALAFLAYAVAALPCKRADEPLALLHSINAVVAKRAHSAQDALRTALVNAGLGSRLPAGEADEEEQGLQPEGAPTFQAGHEAMPGSATAGGGSKQQAPAEAATPVPPGRWQLRGAEVSAAARCSLALSCLLVLKQWLMAAYSLTDERIAAFELKARAGQEGGC